MDLFTIIAILIYLLLTGYLGYRGYKGTKSAADFMVAGRKTHPFIMALSYGATFISTSAIVGFGGAAGIFGMGLLWLTFLNIFLGIFIAFVIFGKRTRKIGHNIDAHTFPELLGRRFNSKFIQGFAGGVIFLFMPLYAGVVAMGAAKFIGIQFHISYDIALFFFVAIVAVYVIMGGIKGVMYTDAFQGVLMFIGMAILLVAAYSVFGGLIGSHEKLTDLNGQIVEMAKKMPPLTGHEGFTAFPTFGSPMWWSLVSTIIMGVGVGVLAQPQLAVRFMTVKSNKEINRAVLVGGVFILMMTGVAFTVGSLSNVFFKEKGVKYPIVMKQIEAEKFEKKILTNISNEEKDFITKCYTKDEAQKSYIVKNDITSEDEKKLKEVVRFKGLTAVCATEIAKTKAAIAGKTKEEIEKVKATADDYIPLYIENFMPPWFAVLFLLTLLSAAMSTLSSQFHVMGTSAGRDIYEEALNKKHGTSSVKVTRGAVLLTIFISTIIAYVLPKWFGKEGEAIIASGTAIFFGLCASTFLPVYIGALYFKKLSRKAVITGMIAGFTVSLFWLVFVHAKESEPLLKIIGATPIGTTLSPEGKVIPSMINNVDPLFIGLPISIIVTFISALFMKASKEEVDNAEKSLNGV